MVINFANLRTCIAGKSSTPAKSPWPGTDTALPCLKEPDAAHCYSLQISLEIRLLFSALVFPSDSQVCTSVTKLTQPGISRARNQWEHRTAARLRLR